MWQNTMARCDKKQHAWEDKKRESQYAQRKLEKVDSGRAEAGGGARDAEACIGREAQVAAARKNLRFRTT